MKVYISIYIPYMLMIDLMMMESIGHNMTIFQYHQRCAIGMVLRSPPPPPPLDGNDEVGGTYRVCVSPYLFIFRKFHGRHTYLVHKFNTSVSHVLKGLFTNCDI